MPEETPKPEGGDGGEGQSNKDDNLVKIRQQLEAANEKIATLEPKALREDVRSAGFDPDSDKGKVLVKDLQRGEVKIEEGQELPDRLKVFAESEYGWKPGANLNQTEQQQTQGGQRLSNLQGSSTSDNPPSGDHDDYLKRIGEAREAGDYATASRLQLEYERKTARAGAR